MLRRSTENYTYGNREYAKGDLVEMAEGAERVRLHGPCFFNNHLHGPGDVIELPKGVEGPHKSRAVSQDKIDYGTDPSIDANRILGEVALDPLFDVIKHEEVADDEVDRKPTAEKKLLEPPDAEKTASAKAELEPPDAK
jgi:hypothetical protein